MAQTLTYDPANDSVEVNDQGLNADEQDSLKVGEELVEAESKLLAGKYKNAEDLEKAYVELQKKLGGESTEDSKPTDESEVQESEEVSEEETEAKEDSEVVSLINEASAEYWDNNKELSPETMEKFKNLSSEELLQGYLEVQNKVNSSERSADLSDSQVNTIRDSVGGEKEYNEVMSWASENLPKDDIDAFDELVEIGNVGAIKLAVSGLKAQYESSTGYEGRMLTGKAPKSSKDVFRSQAQVVEAMSDPRYDRDPAYRQDLIEKLERSDVEW
tara:strand:+ start:307 stop:1125 length:819 start_codon:yes stop_codon:yes gene_type:complete